MEIRRLTVEDYEQIVRLWIKAKLPFEEKGRDCKTAMAVQIKSSPDFFLGAYEGSELVGVAIASNDGRKGWINRLAVDPDHRGLGVAKALISESEKVLRKLDIKIFCVLVDDFNVASKALFEKCGYIERRDIIYFSKRDNAEA